MKSIKLSITSRARLARKYDAAALSLIDKAIKRWIAADAARGITTIHLALDDPKTMKAYKVPAITGPLSPSKVKQALDALVSRLSPDYIVILGAHDVIPLCLVPNPSVDATGDDDDEVPTDNPYACSTPFAKNKRTTYLVPDRVLGRIPDLPGSSDPSWLIDYLDHATTCTPRPMSAYAKGLLVCCDSWRGSGRECASTLGFGASELLITPPTLDGSPLTRNRHGRLLHMIKCHGTPKDSAFYGERQGKFPEAMKSPSLIGRTKRDAVVGAMCCYGASLFDPADPAALKPNELPIPSVYLKQGAHGFLGSTTIAWVGPDTMMCADWVVSAFLKSAVTGSSLGRAALEAKQDFLRWLQQQGVPPDVADEKTLIQFVLLGDPSIHPTVAGAAKEKKALAAAAAVAGGRVSGAKKAASSGSSAGEGASSSVAALQRQQRRAMRHELGAVLRRRLPSREKAVVKAAPKTVERAMKSIIASLKQPKDGGRIRKRRWSAARAQRLTIQQVLPELQPRAAAGVPAAARRARGTLAPRKTYQYYWTARDTVGPGETRTPPRITMVTVRADSAGNVIGSRLVVSS